ncbi:MAG: HNH endonuclease [Alphaproteobacteria bacterium]|nr:HNH endonuclease [Alphaproteobacteria bacterium]
MSRVLLLNADHTPIKTLSWQRAVMLLVCERVVLVASTGDAVVRSEHLELPWPSVVALKQWVAVRQVPALTGRNVHARDDFACCYCSATAAELGHLHPSARLTLDHVVPRSRARHGFVDVPWSEVPVPVNSWLNLVTACGPCNARKGARTPDEARMILRRLPYKPTRRDLIGPDLGRHAPPEWAPWIPARAA